MLKAFFVSSSLITAELVVSDDFRKRLEQLSESRQKTDAVGPQKTPPPRLKNAALFDRS